jgi:hypothetical protein
MHVQHPLKSARTRIANEIRRIAERPAKSQKTTAGSLISLDRRNRLARYSKQEKKERS